MFLVTARINFESYPEKLLLFCACATVQLCNARRARLVLKMVILNAAFYLNHSRVFGWQILKSVVPTDAYSTIFHNVVLPSVVDDVVIIIIIAASRIKSKFIADQKHTILLEWPYVVLLYTHILH